MSIEVTYRRIESSKFFVRMAEPFDAEHLLSVINRNRHRIENYFPGIIRYSSSVTDLTDHLETRKKEATDNKYVIMLVFNISGNDIIGLIQLKEIDTNARKREIGAFSDSKYESQGYMTQALSLLFEHEFSVNGMNKIFLRTAETNISARKLAEKLGFKNEGTLRQDFKEPSGALINTVYYGLLKSDFEEHQSS